MKRIAVFCGSTLGSDGNYAAAAVALGQELVREGIGLVYGGGNIGLMGKIATAVLESGGHVTGIIPKFLMEKEIGKIDVQDLRVVESMHERKALMAEMSDGFIAMPGGFGTLEEVAEIVTWGQLGLHGKPVGVLNVAGFYDHFLAFLDTAVARGFIKPKYRALVLTDQQPAELLAQMKAWKPTAGPRWITPERT
jgi:uncharacterized protein (TIGR00730 family)